MADPEQTAPAEGSSGTAGKARNFAERAMHEQAVGRLDEADRLLARAQEQDPDAAAEVLLEHDAGRTPDARRQDLANQDVEKVPPKDQAQPGLNRLFQTLCLAACIAQSRAKLSLKLGDLLVKPGAFSPQPCKTGRKVAVPFSPPPPTPLD
jgi:hypothetical protein